MVVNSAADYDADVIGVLKCVRNMTFCVPYKSHQLMFQVNFSPHEKMLSTFHVEGKDF
jgi:hypothetical protein